MNSQRAFAAMSLIVSTAARPLQCAPVSEPKKPMEATGMLAALDDAPQLVFAIFGERLFRRRMPSF
jgi:hypothetical protein